MLKALNNYYNFVVVDRNFDRSRLRLNGGGHIESVQNLVDKSISLHLQGTNNSSIMSATRLPGARGDAIVEIANLSVDPGKKFRSVMTRPPTQVGPLCEPAIDVLLNASSGTLDDVLIEKQFGC